MFSCFTSLILRPGTYSKFSVISLRFVSQTYFKQSEHVRKIFPSSINWYPGHMQKGLKSINTKLANVDAIIEIHDSRIPLTGRCQFVNEASQIRPRILIMNKCDLAEPINNMDEYKQFIASNSVFSPYQQPPEDIFFTNMKAPERQKQLIRNILTSLAKFTINLDKDSLSIYNEGEKSEFAAVEEEWENHSADPSLTSITAMVVGLPNCGKSTFINALRSFSQSGRRKAVSVGKTAGWTRNVGEPVIVAHRFPVPRNGDRNSYKQSVRECSIRMIDTPGILEPRSQSLCGQLSLAVCGAVDWNVVDKELLTDYLLFCLNRREKWEYANIFGMRGPTENVYELLAWVSARCNLLRPVSERLAAENDCTVSSTPQPDFYAAAHHFLNAFAEGQLGRLTLLPYRDEKVAAPYFRLAKPTSGRLMHQ